MLVSSCSSLKVNPAAANDESVAISAINQIRASGIVVIFPTEHKKEKALIKFAKSNPSLQKDIEKLRAKRTNRLAVWNIFKHELTFSKVSIVPDSLLKSYIADPSDIKEIDGDSNLVSANLGNIYVLYTDYGGFEIKRNGQFIANPFPNKVQAAWGSSIREFLGMQSEEKSADRFFNELNTRLNEFYGLTLIERN